MSISIDERLYEKLKHFVPSKQISRFVANAINKELASEEAQLRADYTAAEQDSSRNKELEEWDQIND
jgi:hypothetical protein